MQLPSVTSFLILAITRGARFVRTLVKTFRGRGARATQELFTELCCAVPD